MRPTEAILSGSVRAFSTSDKHGRKLVVRALTALDTLRLFKAAGPTLSQNEPWLAMASLASSVQEIDGIPVPAPVNEAQIEALIERLGEVGLAAVATATDGQEDFLESGTRGKLARHPVLIDCLYLVGTGCHSMSPSPSLRRTEWHSL